MENNTNKKLPLKVRYKNSKFYKFCKKHRKLLVTSGVTVAVVLTLTLPFIETDPQRGDFSYAYDAYKDLKFKETDKNYSSEVLSSLHPSEISDGTTKKVGVSLTLGQKVSYKVDIDKLGEYYFEPTYFINANGFNDHEIEIQVDSKVVDNIKIKADFENTSDKFLVDSYGNEVVPSQSVINLWQTKKLYKEKEQLPLSYEFKEVGEHVITFTLVSGDLISFSTLNLIGTKNLIAYKDYIEEHKSETNGKRLDKEIQGENFSLKNDTTPIPTSIPDLNAYPYHSLHKKLNIVSNFSKNSQMLTYKFEVPVKGMYTINFNYQVKNSNHTTFATIYLDGEVPFGELLHYPFNSTKQLQEEVLRDNNKNLFKFYLTEGTHEITLKIDNSLLNTPIRVIENSILELNSIYLRLKRIAGTVKDNNKEWDPDTDFPGIKEEIEKIYKDLSELKPILYKVNGSNSNFQAIINIESALNTIVGILKKPKMIPNNYHKFSEGSGSILESLSNAKQDLEDTPLEIDRIIIGTDTDYRLRNRKNGWHRFCESVKKFFVSFGTDYSPNKKAGKTLNIWVARSRQYVDLMQQMFDASDFKERTGYDVQFTLLADESKLILSNAAHISPDGVMGISNWLPYEMGIRDLTVDLTQFDDYKDVIKRFSPGALISLIADGKGLALPETQDFYVTYYRKDICEANGFDIPNTWDEVVSLLPKLQRNGFNYYIPLSSSSASKSIMTTAPFIYQNGGNLFTDDGTKTTIDEENSLDAIKFMTELYTLYGLQDQVSNFFDAFRNGSLPIGVSTFDTYVKLALGAPEIDGMWDIALSPGVKQADGTISRWQTGSAQSMCLINKTKERNDAGWELLKWWSSKEVQAEFGQKLTLLYGKGYIWNSANLEAFNESIIFKKSHKKVILDQWEWMREIPRVPGWYMLERELSNAWNNIVLKAQNTRAVIENAVTLINKELQRKLIEFGYLDKNGNTITPYKVTTLQTIEEIMTGGAKL